MRETSRQVEPMFNVLKKLMGEPYSSAELERLRELRICPVCRKGIEGIGIDGLCSDNCSGKWDGFNRCVR
jgi:hypothetical protein